MPHGPTAGCVRLKVLIGKNLGELEATSSSPVTNTAGENCLTVHDIGRNCFTVGRHQFVRQLNHTPRPRNGSTTLAGT